MIERKERLPWYDYLDLFFLASLALASSKRCFKRNTSKKSSSTERGQIEMEGNGEQQQAQKQRE